MGSSGGGKGGSNNTWVAQKKADHAKGLQFQAAQRAQAPTGSGGEPGKTYTFQGKPGTIDWRGAVRALKPVGQFAIGDWPGSLNSINNIRKDNVTARDDAKDVKRVAAQYSKPGGGGGAGTSALGGSDDDEGGYGTGL